LLQRAERYVILGFGTIFGALFARVVAPWWPAQRYALIILTILVLALLVNFTAVQRVVHVWRQLGDQGSA
jgi:phosphatidylglycerophosphate synthase